MLLSVAYAFSGVAMVSTFSEASASGPYCEPLAVMSRWSVVTTIPMFIVVFQVFIVLAKLTLRRTQAQLLQFDVNNALSTLQGRYVQKVRTLKSVAPCKLMPMNVMVLWLWGSIYKGRCYSLIFQLSHKKFDTLVLRVHVYLTGFI